MKSVGLIVFVLMAVVTLSYIPSEAAVYRTKSKATCSGVSKSKEYSKAKSCSGSVSRSKVRAKRSCAG